jgi:hypothetical protein
MTQQDKQMKIGARKGFAAQHSVNVVLLAITVTGMTLIPMHIF